MTWSVTPVIASDEKGAQEIFRDMKELSKMNEQVQKVGIINPECLSCIEKPTALKVELDKDSVDLGKPLFPADDVPYTMILKRTSKSPAKINLKLKNGYRYCEKPIVTAYGVGCVLHLYNYEDEELSLNLKNLPKLKDGEEEMIEVKLTKPDINNARYSVEVKNLSVSSARESVDRKFFGSGFNVGFEMKRGSGE